SAAHCCADGVDFIVYGTARKYTPLSHYLFQKASVAHIYIHPKYNSGVSGHDIAIIKLSRPILPNPTAKAVDLETESGHCNMDAVVYGFGQSSYSYNPSLQRMYTRIINNCRTRSINDHFILAQVQEG